MCTIGAGSGKTMLQGPHRIASARQDGKESVRQGVMSEKARDGKAQRWKLCLRRPLQEERRRTFRMASRLALVTRRGIFA